MITHTFIKKNNYALSNYELDSGGPKGVIAQISITIRAHRKMLKSNFSTII